VLAAIHLRASSSHSSIIDRSVSHCGVAALVASASNAAFEGREYEPEVNHYLTDPTKYQELPRQPDGRAASTSKSGNCPTVRTGTVAFILLFPGSARICVGRAKVRLLRSARPDFRADLAKARVIGSMVAHRARWSTALAAASTNTVNCECHRDFPDLVQARALVFPAATIV
jgi:hypothetical protein